jgi:hypothetical protein
MGNLGDEKECWGLRKVNLIKNITNTAHKMNKKEATFHVLRKTLSQTNYCYGILVDTKT